MGADELAEVVDGGLDVGVVFGFSAEHVDAGHHFGAEGFFESLTMEIQGAVAGGGADGLEGDGVVGVEGGLEADLFEEFFVDAGGIPIGMVLFQAVFLAGDVFVLVGAGALSDFPLAELVELPVVWEIEVVFLAEEVAEVFGCGHGGEELLAPEGAFGFGEGEPEGLQVCEFRGHRGWMVGLMDVGCRIPDAGCQIPDARYRMPDTGCRFRSAAVPDHSNALTTDDTASFTSAIKAWVGEKVRFPGNPIFKMGRKPLKNGVKIG